MAKLKKTAGKTASRTTAKPSAKATAGAAPRVRRSAGKPDAPRIGNKSITESAQQIWLAGMGAFNRAQAEGSKLFETLVRDGLSLEQTARKFAGTRANVVRDAVEGHVGQARERAADTWDKLEKVFEERVQRALVKLGVPGRDDLAALTDRVERLTEALRKANAGTATPARKAPKPAAKSAPKAAPARSAGAPRKAATKRTNKAAKPATKPEAPAAADA